MPRRPDSAQLDLAEIFRRVQQEMLAQLAVSRLFEHASSAGAASEQQWLEILRRYLPNRYRCTPAFIIDAEGRRSRKRTAERVVRIKKWCDIAIFDNLYSLPLFPHDAGLHVPAESVYAVFEVKPTFSKQWLRDAAEKAHRLFVPLCAKEKAASVRVLRRTTVPVIAAGNRRRAIAPSPILAGLLATSSVWSSATFAENLQRALGIGDTPGLREQTAQTANRRRVAAPAPSLYRLDLGCSLQHGAFERTDKLRISTPDESLIFFVLRLIERLRAMGTAPAADWMQYARSLRSFSKL